MSQCVSTPKEWTGRSSATTIIDSSVEKFTDGGLLQKGQWNPNIGVVGLSTDSDVCGGIYNVAMTEQGKDFFDQNIFAFSF